ncbi:MAG: hypothetical protein ACREK8_07520 [Gemmatimonadales bacterium]
MRKGTKLGWSLAAVIAVPLAAQTPTPVIMPAGAYIIQPRDSMAKPDDVGITGWPFVLKSNGAFTLTSPDSLTFTGKLEQKNGLATYTDQNCGDPGVYYVRKERGGYAFDVKSEACPGRDSGWVKLLFVPGRPKKTP